MAGRISRACSANPQLAPEALRFDNVPTRVPTGPATPRVSAPTVTPRAETGGRTIRCNATIVGLRASADPSETIRVRLVGPTLPAASIPAQQ